MHYYNFHIGDYKSHTNHLTIIEDLAYRRLLDLYYMTEKPIIGDQAARLICMKEHGHEVLGVLLEFFEETAEGFINKRSDAEIASYKAMSEGGKKGAQKRWDNYRNGEAIGGLSPANDNPNATLIATNNQEPRTKNQSKTRETTIPENFAISDSVREWADKNGYHSLEKHHSNFVDACLAKGYKYANWDAAFRNAIKNNWAKVGDVKANDDIWAGVSYGA